jgi:hypothetical protein
MCQAVDLGLGEAVELEEELLTTDMTDPTFEVKWKPPQVLVQFKLHHL